MLDCENTTWKLCELAALFYFIYSLDLSDFGAFAVTWKGIHFLTRKRITGTATLDQMMDINPGFCLYLLEAEQTWVVNKVSDKGKILNLLPSWVTAVINTCQ